MRRKSAPSGQMGEVVIFCNRIHFSIFTFRNHIKSQTGSPDRAASGPWARCLTPLIHAVKKLQGGLDGCLPNGDDMFENVTSRSDLFK